MVRRAIPKNKPEEDQTPPPTEDGSQNPPSDDEIVIPKKFVPVLMQFKEGFWCASLQRSFMPGNYMALSAQEVKALSPFSLKK